MYNIAKMQSILNKEFKHYPKWIYESDIIEQIIWYNVHEISVLTKKVEGGLGKKESNHLTYTWINVCIMEERKKFLSSRVFTF